MVFKATFWATFFKEDKVVAIKVILAQSWATWATFSSGLQHNFFLNLLEQAPGTKWDLKSLVRN